MLRRLRAVLLAGAACMLVAVGGAAAANAGVLGGAGPTTSEAPSLSFTDGAGRPTDAAYFDVAGAYPGMRPQVSTATLANPTDVELEHQMSVRITSPPHEPSLADALVLQVTQDGHTVYDGPLSTLAFDGAEPVGPRSSVSYEMTLSWPDGGEADNALQGVVLQFDIVARSWAPHSAR